MTKSDSLLVDSLTRNVSFLEKQVQDLHNHVLDSQSFISNTIAASDRFLSVASLVIAIVAIGIGVYIAWCQYSVEKIKRIVEEKEKDILRLKTEVEDTNRMINCDLSSLYQKLRREETLTLLNRLVEVPDDINNIVRALLIRDLQVEDFSLLHTAFTEAIKEEEDYKRDSYLILFFQHFAGLSIMDNTLRELIVNDIDRLVSMCFKKDIQKSTADIVSVMDSLSPDTRMQIIIPFYKAYKKSKFKDLYTIEAQLRSALTDEQWNSVIAQTTEGEEEGDD